MAGPNGETCTRCIWRGGQGGSGGSIGECRRRSPSNSFSFTGFAPVMPDTWCGDFSAEPVQIARPESQVQ